MDRKQKLLADVDAEANAKRQAIESNTQRIAQTDELCERINNAQPSVFKAVVTDTTLNNLRRRLERWELLHLRAHCAELNERLERAEAETERAWESAEFWQRNGMDLQQALWDAGETVGLTKNGAMGVMHTDDDLMVERRGRPIEAAFDYCI